MKTNLTLKQHDISEALKSQYTTIDKIEAIKYIKSIFGNTTSLHDIVKSWNYIYN